MNLGRTHSNVQRDAVPTHILATVSVLQRLEIRHFPVRSGSEEPNVFGP
jgi:hypothetical protein